MHVVAAAALGPVSELCGAPDVPEKSMNGGGHEQSALCPPRRLPSMKRPSMKRTWRGAADIECRIGGMSGAWAHAGPQGEGCCSPGASRCPVAVPVAVDAEAEDEAEVPGVCQVV